MNNYKILIDEFDGHSGYVLIQHEDGTQYDRMHFSLPRPEDDWEGIGWHEFYPPSDKYLERFLGENAYEKLEQLIKNTEPNE